MPESLVTGHPRPPGSLLIVRDSPAGRSRAQFERRWLRVVYVLKLAFVVCFGAQMIRWAL